MEFGEEEGGGCAVWCGCHGDLLLNNTVQLGVVLESGALCAVDV